MLLVHFTTKDNVSSILKYGITELRLFRGYQFVGSENSIPEKINVTDDGHLPSIFCYPLIKNKDAAYNCWADLNNPEPMEEGEYHVIERNIAIIFKIPDFEEIYVGQWGLPYEGTTYVDKDYMQAGYDYKRKIKFSDFKKESNKLLEDLKKWSKNKYSDWYDLITYWESDDDENDRWKELNWPTWAYPGFEICVMRSIEPEEILGTHEVKSYKELKKPWFNDTKYM